uniref:tether containing UBX domain for GLUT4 isoform X2 n=1 Tax=Ciona intestinalis TaxID=7719 RepID=UPI0000522E14|nr:tether containing UBX domain for GLUT4 isoform X2 [Ciona intestinalis]|eukprot:XP_026695534.1 tether containing UBX domain for GLUT4 isoform X2 [Ciona intestinalis]
MSKSVVVLCLSGRRRTVKFTPNFTIVQILEEVCKKENLDPACHELRNGRSVVDRSLPWRYTNLPNNAKLELFESKQTEGVSDVRIAVQLDNGHRLQGTFSSPSTLLAIVQNFSEEIKKQLPEEHLKTPSVVYMRQEITGEELLSKSTLRQLGIVKGSALLRLSYKEQEASTSDQSSSHKSSDPPPSCSSQPPVVEKKSSEPKVFKNSDDLKNINKEDAPKPASPSDPPITENSSVSSMSVGSVYKSTSDASMMSLPDIVSDPDTADVKEQPSTSKVSEDGNSTTKRIKTEESESPEETSYQVDLSNFKFPEESKGQSLYDSASCSYNESALSEPCDRQEVLFLEKGRNTQSNEEVDDKFFEVTVEDVRNMMADLQQERKKHESKELLTEEIRKARRLEKASKYPKVIVRVIFPSRHVLQAMFNPLETMKELYAIVEEHVSQSFYLYTSPPKEILKDKTVTLFEAGFAPAARVYISANASSTQLLQESSLEKLEDADVANMSLACVFKIPNKTTAATSKNKEEKLKKFLKIGKS